MADDFQNKVGPTERIEPNQPIKGSDQEPEPSKSFKSYMDENPSNPSEGTSAQQAQTEQAMSPAELTQQQSPALGTPTMESVQKQMESASSTLGDLQKKLQTPNLKFKNSQKYLLRNKLSEANQHLRAAAKKSGAKVDDLPEEAKSQNPLTRFLNLVVDGQNQMNNAQAQIAKIAQSKKSISPSDLLLVQLKLSKAQQELEYSSVVINNAVSDVKMLFNVQL